MSYTTTQAQAGRTTALSMGRALSSGGGSYVRIEEVRSDPWEAHWKLEDVSNMDSGADSEWLAILRDNGRLPIYANRVSMDVGQEALLAAWDSGALYPFRLQLPARPDQGGMGDLFLFAALVEELNWECDVEKCITYTGVLKVSGSMGDTTVARGSATGYLRRYSSNPFATEYTGVMWGDFSVQSMPVGAVVTGIYPVLVASATHDGAYSYYSYGGGYNLTTHFPNSDPTGGFTVPFNPEGQSFGTTVFHGASLGTSLAVLADREIQVLMDATLNLGGLTDVIDVTGVGFAITYTSAAPVIDPQLPQPFGIADGAGLAWATPLSEADTGVAENGYATGTSALRAP